MIGVHFRGLRPLLRLLLRLPLRRLRLNQTRIQSWRCLHSRLRPHTHPQGMAFPRRGPRTLGRVTRTLPRLIRIPVASLAARLTPASLPQALVIRRRIQVRDAARVWMQSAYLCVFQL